MTSAETGTDDEKPTAAGKTFRTTPEAATGNATPEDGNRHRKRASFLAWPTEGGLPDLTGPVDGSAGSRASTSR